MFDSIIIELSTNLIYGIISSILIYDYILSLTVGTQFI